MPETQTPLTALMFALLKPVILASWHPNTALEAPYTGRRSVPTSLQRLTANAAPRRTLGPGPRSTRTTPEINPQTAAAPERNVLTTESLTALAGWL